MTKKYRFFCLIAAVIVSRAMVSASPSEILMEYWARNFNDSTASITKRLEYADSLIKYAGSESERIALLFKKGNVAYSVGNYPNAISAYRQLYSLPKVDITDYQRLNIIDRMARCEHYMGNYEKSVAFAKELLETPKHDSLKYFNANAYVDISQVYMRFQKPNVAKSYLQKADRYIASIGGSLSPYNKNEIMKRIYLGLSGAEILLGNIDEANKDLEYAEKMLGQGEVSLNVLINLAIIYEMLQENGIAEDYYKKITETANRDFNKAVAMNNYAVFCLMNGRLDEAIRITDSNRALLYELQMNHAISHMYLIRATAFAQMDDYRQAYCALDSARMVNDSVFALDKEQEILRLTSEFDNASAENMRSAAQREISKRGTIITSLIIVLLTAVCVLSVFVFREKRQRKLNHGLETDIEHIKEQHNEELKSVAKDNELHNRELTQFALRFANINEAIDRMVQLTAGKRMLTENEIASLNSRLKELRAQDVSWDSFRLYFGQIHKSFFDNLYIAHPDLTQGETRMSALVSMNLTAKEIALLTNRSVRTVETMKYRLAKKLSLPPDTTLYDYLRSLL